MPICKRCKQEYSDGTELMFGGDEDYCSGVCKEIAAIKKENERLAGLLGVKPLNASMDNVDAVKLGEIAVEVGTQKEGIGDGIDRGLILRRRLEEEGFVLMKSRKSGS